MACFRLIVAAIGASAPLAAGFPKYMTCGEGVDVCGVLVLETGLGKGVYHHGHAAVHGLWPQVDEFGSSQCVAPEDTTEPDHIYDCYNDMEDSKSHLLWFESHEWDRHGKCAGAKSADDFFSQICSLSKAPVQLLNQAKAKSPEFSAMEQALADGGYTVYDTDVENDQMLLPVCRQPGGTWVMSTVDDFFKNCGTHKSTVTKEVLV